MEKQKFALVTGCGKGGIGHALARQLRSKNFHVFATLLAFEDKQHLEDIGVQVIVCDVTSDEDVSALKRIVEQTTNGKLSVLINNAGICYTMTAADTEISEVEKMFAVNVFGPMRMVREFHRFIVATKGVIVNIGSVGGIVPYVYGASYNASKAALHHYGNTLRTEMKPFGVKVVNVISGEVSTNILQRDKMRKRQLPKESIYAPLATDFEAHISRTPNTITPDQYAAAVVDEILKISPVAWFWYGAQTFTVRWCDTFLPRTFWDWLFSRMFHFEKLTV